MPHATCTCTCTSMCNHARCDKHVVRPLSTVVHRLATSADVVWSWLIKTGICTSHPSRARRSCTSFTLWLMLCVGTIATILWLPLRMAYYWCGTILKSFTWIATYCPQPSRNSRHLIGARLQKLWNSGTHECRRVRQGLRSLPPLRRSFVCAMLADSSIRWRSCERICVAVPNHIGEVLRCVRMGTGPSLVQVCTSPRCLP
mmetsp:Transcript_28907/g.74605  ORF Transcript_28907/g.74605 Transcript_28907/m.74605 type:complete len:201 (-) Transcript_28907:953-1555(-)